MKRSVLGSLALLMASAPAVMATQITIKVENIAPQNGVVVAPVWVGFHNGTFDGFDSGSPASAALESLAEDGNSGPLSAAFSGSGAGMHQATLLGPGAPGFPPVIFPGQSAMMSFDLDGADPANRYLSYAAMIVPSNDAFVGNDNPTAFEVFDGSGNFTPFSFMILGTDIRDAGTEVNDEVPMNTALFGQMMPNTGGTEGGNVMMHPGYNAPGSGGILDSPDFANADFTQSGYQVALVTVTPEPASLLMLGLGGVLATVRRRSH